MAATKLSSREFNQDTSRAKKRAANAVLSSTLTEDVRLTYYLLLRNTRSLPRGRRALWTCWECPQFAEAEFELPRMKGNLHQPADLS